jgi:hypothetical protein
LRLLAHLLGHQRQIAESLSISNLGPPTTELKSLNRQDLLPEDERPVIHILLLEMILHFVSLPPPPLEELAMVMPMEED